MAVPSRTRGGLLALSYFFCCVELLDSRLFFTGIARALAVFFYSMLEPIPRAGDKLHWLQTQAPFIPAQGILHVRRVGPASENAHTHSHGRRLEIITAEPASPETFHQSRPMLGVGMLTGVAVGCTLAILLGLRGLGSTEASLPRS